MTRKDYILISSAIRDTMLICLESHEQVVGAKAAFESAAARLANALAQDNPRFDRERFLKPVECKAMKKQDIETRYERGTYYPAINVKVYNWPWSHYDIQKHFNCAEDCAERASEFAAEMAQEQFWEQIQENTSDHFPGCGAFSAGRSNGWLLIEGLPDVESWDAVRVAKWAKFCKEVKAEIDYLTSLEYAIENIEANEWTKPHSERFNFLDKNGETICLADLKAQAIAAGFGPVVRQGV